MIFLVVLFLLAFTCIGLWLFLGVCSHFIWFYGHFIVLFMSLYLFYCSCYIVLVLHLFFMFLLLFLLASLFKVILCNFVVIFDFVMSSMSLTLWSFSVFYFHLLFSFCLWGIMFVFFVPFCFFCNRFDHFSLLILYFTRLKKKPLITCFSLFCGLFMTFIGCKFPFIVISVSL